MAIAQRFVLTNASRANNETSKSKQKSVTAEQKQFCHSCSIEYILKPVYMTNFSFIKTNNNPRARICLTIREVSVFTTRNGSLSCSQEIDHVFKSAFRQSDQQHSHLYEAIRSVMYCRLRPIRLFQWISESKFSTCTMEYGHYSSTVRISRP